MTAAPDEPLVSVIVPAFNAARTIARCLSDLFASDYPRLEVLVVDDASTDDTRERCVALRCRVIRQPSNRGAAACRNLGAREARGEILCFVDADVAVRPDAIRHLADSLRDPGRAAAVIGRYTAAQEVTGFFSVYQNLFTLFNHERSGDEVGWFWTALGAVRADVFLATGGFNERYRTPSAEDVEFGYGLADRGYRIRYDRRVEAVHLHRHTLRSLLRNSFIRGAALVELGWRMRPKDRFAHGFSDRRNLYALVAAAALTIAVGGAVTSPRWAVPALAAAAVFVLANLPFYRFACRQQGPGFAGKAVVLQYLVYLTVGAAAALGTFRCAVGRGAPRRPRC